MLGIHGVRIIEARRTHFVLSQTRPTSHPGSKVPTARNYKTRPPGFRHNRKLNRFNEWCYETGNLNAVRRDYRG